MTEQVLELMRALGAAQQDETVLRTLCQNACDMLDRQLRDGLTAQDCGETYPLAAAWIALDWLRGGQGLDGVTYLSAGDMTVRRDGGGEAGSLSRKAREIMGPFLRDDGFVFRGVKG